MHAQTPYGWRNCAHTQFWLRQSLWSYCRIRPFPCAEAETTPPAQGDSSRRDLSMSRACLDQTALAVEDRAIRTRNWLAQGLEIS